MSYIRVERYPVESRFYYQIFGILYPGKLVLIGEVEQYDYWRWRYECFIQEAHEVNKHDFTVLCAALDRAQQNWTDLLEKKVKENSEADGRIFADI